jgi:hypothetical protein
VISWFFLAGSILILFYTYYRAEITFQGFLSAKYFKYYIGSVGGILFWIVVLRLKEEFRSNIMLACFSLIVGLYLIEGALNFFDQLTISRKTKAFWLDIEFDKRTRLQVIKDLRNEGMDAVPILNWTDSIGSILLKIRGLNNDAELFRPLGGISKKTTIMSNESGEYGIYLSDRYGFNNPDSVWDLPQTKWLLIGDSFVNGYSVQIGQDIAGQIRLITNASVINLGIGGNGPLIELATLKEYGEAMRPKKVLWVYYEDNDFIMDLGEERKFLYLTQYLNDDFSQDLIHQQKEIDIRLNEYVNKMETLRTEEQERKKAARGFLYNTRWMRLAKIRTMIGLEDEVRWNKLEWSIDPLFAKILTKAKTRTEEWGGEFYFVYLPTIRRYNRIVDHKLFRKRAKVIDIVKGLNIPVIDIHNKVFANHPDPLDMFPLRMYGHYSAEGYREVAKAIVSGVSCMSSNECVSK